MPIVLTARQKTIKTIQSLLRTAQDLVGATEDERNSASDLATKWIARHQIEDAELAKDLDNGPQKIVSFKIEVSNMHGLGRLRQNALYWAVVTPLGGSAYHTYFKSAKVPTRMTIFLPENVADFAKTMLESFAAQLDLAMAQANRENLDRLPSYYGSKERNRASLVFRRSYITAWGSRVGDRMRMIRATAVEEMRKELMATAYANGVDGEELAKVGSDVALVDPSLRTKTAMDDYFASLFGTDRKLKPARKTRYQLSSEGQRAGRRDGDLADLGQRALAA